MSHLLEVQNLKTYFKTSSGYLHAVDDISFTLDEGKTLGVVGESGCGKSTLGRTILGLQAATSGSVKFDGQEIIGMRGRARKKIISDMQMIFQDPFSSLNPHYCVYELIADPLKVYHICRSKKELDQRVRQLMDTVGLAERFMFSYPHELDGGRRQRIGVARALALDPRFIVCDEPVSALDVSIQAQILNLLQDLQEQKNLAYMFVTHDLSVVKHISDEIMVMYLGCLVEKSPAKELFKLPLHPYTKGLLSAIPIPTIDEKPKRIIMKGEIASPINPKPCCRFAGRCPYATELCWQQQPQVQEVRPGHLVACHHTMEINRDLDI